MDGYLQTTLAAKGISSNRSSSVNSPKLIPPPCPPTNKENDCKEFHTPEGIYDMIQETFFETIAPNFVTGTHMSLSSVHTRNHGIPFARLPSRTSSMSENGLTPTSTRLEYGMGTTVLEEEQEHTMEAHDDGTMPLSNGHAPRIQFTKTAAWPIPRSTSGQTSRSLLSSSSSVEPSTPRRSRKLSAYKLASSYQDTDTLELPMNLGPSMSMELNDEILSTSYTAPGSHIGSLPSLFTPRPRRSVSIRAPTPKSSLSKTKSSFVERVVIHDQFAKWIGSRTPESSFLFFNTGKNFVCMDMDSTPKDPLARIAFSSAYPTCHDVNLSTCTNEHIDVIIGFSSGDCLWYDPIGNKYSRINKNGMLNASGVSIVKWVPGSEDLFVAAFNDGTILVLDKDREDLVFIPPAAQSWAEEQFHASRPHKHSKYNPLSHWRVSQKGISALAFSPDGSHIAAVGADGLLRIIDFWCERLCDVFCGYYGRLECVAWSPDGRYILTGGQDDLVTIWAFREQRIVARCQGHKSWVTGICFDPRRCDDMVYRFASVGEDCKLILWDFSVNALHRPKQKMKRHPSSITLQGSKNDLFAHATPKERRKELESSVESLSGLRNTTSVSDTLTKGTSTQSAFSRFRKRSSATHGFGSSAGSDGEGHAQHVQLPTIHPPLNKYQVPFLQPIMTRTVHADPCVDVAFRDDCVFTTDRRGRIRKWRRRQ